MPRPDFLLYCPKTQKIRLISVNDAGDVAAILAGLAA
jgi:hypothetical protein